jgi:hypothetical protein
MISYTRFLFALQRLFVAQTDNIDTSACISNPPEVSFLLNGKGVEKRVNIAMDTGPQLPTNVTAQLKYGTNLLQVMGNFKGFYSIIYIFFVVHVYLINILLRCLIVQRKLHHHNCFYGTGSAT